MSEFQTFPDGNIHVTPEGDVVSAEDGVNAPHAYPVNRQWDHDVYPIQSAHEEVAPNEDGTYGGDHLPFVDDTRMSEDEKNANRANLANVREQFLNGSHNNEE
jgi:hypothetical protein